MDFNSLIQRKRERFEQLERDIADPSLFDNRKRASEVMREHSSIKGLLAVWEDLETARLSSKTTANSPVRTSLISPKWRRKKFRCSRNGSPISSATCR